MYIRSKNDESGMSLIEVVVAAALILGVLVTTAYFATRSQAIQASLDSENKAIQVARDYAERIMAVPFKDTGFYMHSEGWKEKNAANQLTITIPPDRDALTFNPKETKTIGGNIYTVETELTRIPMSTNWSPLPSTTSQPINVKVTVTWEEADGKTRSTSLQRVKYPGAEEQLSQKIDKEYKPGDIGQPSTPTFYDQLDNYAGIISPTTGTYQIIFNVNNQGSSKIKDIVIEAKCESNNKVYSFNYAQIQSKPSNVIRITPALPAIDTSPQFTLTVDPTKAEGSGGSTLFPAGCGFLGNVNPTHIRVVNDQGASGSMTITDSNYKIGIL